MVNWYSKGQSQYTEGNFHMAYYIDMDGYDETNYDSQDIEGEGEVGDPFMTFAIDTETWAYGQGQVEIGLLGSHRIRINSSGVRIWTAGDVWVNPLEGGAGGDLNDLDDVVISGTPADNELLAWDNGTSRWINQTAAEAELATAGHGHGQLHDESHSLSSHSSEAHNELTGYNDETDVKHLTDAQLGALHAIYTLEAHNNTYHSTNYHSESDGTGVVTVHSDVTSVGSGAIITTNERNALHAIYTLEQHDNNFHSTNYHTESDGTGAVTIHSGITNAGSGIIISDAERTALHAQLTNLTELATRNHNDLLNINAGDAYEHITQTQKNLLHAIYTLEQHDNAYHSTNYEPTISPKNTAFNKDFGTLVTEVCVGNDSRLSDARTPTAHDHDGNTLRHDAVDSSASFSITSTGAITITSGGGITFTLGGASSMDQALGMGSNKITSLANGTAASDAMAFGQKYSLESHNNTFHSTNYHSEADGTGVATVHSDITSIGSGAIITTGERNALHAAVTEVYNLKATDDRDYKPNTSASWRFVKAFFTTLGGMTGGADTNYQDLLILNTYSDGSGGDMNALTFDKSEKLIKHWLADQTDGTWGTPKTLAYVEDTYTQAEVDAIEDRFDEQSSTFPGSPVEGDFHYDEDDDSLYRYNAEALAWIEVGVGGGLGASNFVPPVGFITMFSGAWTDNSTIPGWYKCDGNNGTPNLVNKFIRGATTSGGSGGSDNAVVVQHNHGINVTGILTNAYHLDVAVSTSGQYVPDSNAIMNAGESGSGKNIPAYYALIFIMRVN